MKIIRGSRLLGPSRILVMSFLAIIALGTLLLMLPASSKSGITFTDALFTSTSAVCVTGLIVKSTPGDFTVFGKAVILLLIQIGGLGYMSLSTVIALILGRKIGLSERILLRESLNIDSMEGIIRFIKQILVFVLAAEGIGAVLLTLAFSRHYALSEAAYYGVFHAISAFNNAGFSLFDDSLVGFVGDIPINLIIMALIVVGGIGFMVVVELWNTMAPGAERRVPHHSKIVLTATAVLIVAGAVLFYLAERNYYLVSHGSGAPLLESVFSSVTARTAGFNTVAFAKLQPVTLFLVMTLMLIGASPGSTGGGIKTTTFSVIIMHIWCTVRGSDDTSIFRRKVPDNLIAKALVIFTLSILYVSVITFVIIDIEHSAFEATMFEVVSAFGTVGLSVGDGGSSSLSATFSDASKLILALTMLLGRVGPLTLFSALLERGARRYRYPEGGILIG
jgi:trk system potassium uptake protein TrkH